MSKLKIIPRKASDITKEKITASGIRNDFFNEDEYPLFYHAYNPQNSFIAVPPEWLKELAEKAKDLSLAKIIEESIQNIQGEKERIIEDLRNQTKARLNAKNKDE